MTHDQLLAFVTVASTGSFSGASEVLHKTQPAISKLIRNLEADLGLTLFDRSSYRAKLTEVGRRFHVRALALVHETDALRGFGRRLATAEEEEVRLVLEAITPLARVLPILRRVQARHPALRYALETERAGGVVEALVNDRADLVIAGAGGLERRRFVERRLCEVRIVPVARFDHPLALAPSPAPSELLREYPQIVLRDSGVNDSGRDINVIAGGRRWTVTDIEAKRELIASGMGWGGMPEHAVRSAIERGELRELEVREFVVEAIPLSLLRRRDRTLGRGAEALWKELRGF